MSPPWVGSLRGALDSEYGMKPRIGSLATVDGAGRPRVRAVVCRRVEDDGTLWVASDSRSAKNAQVRAHPVGEIAFWLPSRREQYRAGGAVEILAPDDPRRAVLWRELSDSARALFFWDAPEETMSDPPGPNPRSVPAAAAIPETFEVLVLRPDRVESLDLKPHPHARHRWKAADGWSGEAIHP